MPIELGQIVKAPVRITQAFGDNPAYYGKFGFMGHEGVDFAAPIGSEIMSATGGTVIFAGDKGNNYGNYVQIWDSEKAVMTLYAHLLDTTVKTDDIVGKGQTIGHLGNSGVSTGPHLHFMVGRTEQPRRDINILSGNTIQSANFINPNNGYKGWENPLNKSVYDWPFGYGVGEAALTEKEIIEDNTEDKNKIPAKDIFDTIYNKYYAGWGREAAEQDYIKAYHSNESELRVARGLADEGKKKSTKKRPALLDKTYSINPHWAGLSLQEIQNSGIDIGRADILAGFLGISPEQKLVAGQLITLGGFPTDYYPTSSEWLGVKKLTDKGTIGNKGDYYIKLDHAGMNLHDIRNKTNLPFRPDLLGKYLGIGDKAIIYADSGYGIQGFPNIYDTGSAEVQAFYQLFTKTPPVVKDAISGINESIDEEDSQIEAEPQAATIRINSIPSKARFYIDGLYYGDLTPSNKAYIIDPGIHVIMLEKTGYQTEMLEVDIAEKEQKIIEIELKQKEETTLRETKKVVGTQTAGDYAVSTQVQALVVRIEKLEKEIEYIKQYQK